MNLKKFEFSENFSRFILLVSITISVMIANRWLILSSDNFSVGRVWPLYVSYGDFGFFRRGLFGTLLNSLGLTSVFSNDYILPITLACVCIVSLALILYSMCIKAKLNNLETFLVMFSPAILFHLSYSGMGSLDLLFVLALFTLIWSNNKNIIVDFIVITVGILCHEIFFFLAPAILFCRYFNREINRPYAALCLCCFALLTAFVSTQTLGISKESYDMVLMAKMPMAFPNGNIGHAELFSNLSGNMYIGINQLKTMLINWNIVYWFIPTLYAFSLPLLIINNFKSKIDKLTFLMSCYFPLSIIIVASDYYRWVCLSCAISIVLILKLKIDKRFIINEKLLYVLIPFSAFIAFGGADINWPFPIWQAILTKF